MCLLFGENERPRSDRTCDASGGAVRRLHLFRCFGAPAPVGTPRDSFYSHRFLALLARLARIQDAILTAKAASLEGPALDDAVELAVRMVVRGLDSPVTVGAGLRAIVDASPSGGEAAVRWALENRAWESAGRLSSRNEASTRVDAFALTFSGGTFEPGPDVIGEEFMQGLKTDDVDAFRAMTLQMPHCRCGHTIWGSAPPSALTSLGFDARHLVFDAIPVAAVAALAGALKCAELLVNPHEAEEAMMVLVAAGREDLAGFIATVAGRPSQDLDFARLRLMKVPEKVDVEAACRVGNAAAVLQGAEEGAPTDHLKWFTGMASRDVVTDLWAWPQVIYDSLPSARLRLADAVAEFHSAASCRIAVELARHRGQCAIVKLIADELANGREPEWETCSRFISCVTCSGSAFTNARWLCEIPRDVMLTVLAKLPRSDWLEEPLLRELVRRLDFDGIRVLKRKNSFIFARKVGAGIARALLDQRLDDAKRLADLGRSDQLLGDAMYALVTRLSKRGERAQAEGVIAELRRAGITHWLYPERSRTAEATGDVALAHQLLEAFGRAVP